MSARSLALCQFWNFEKICIISEVMDDLVMQPLFIPCTSPAHLHDVTLNQDGVAITANAAAFLSLISSLSQTTIADLPFMESHRKGRKKRDS